MENKTAEVSDQGKSAQARVLSVEGRRLDCGGRWLKVARIHDELWLEGQPVENPGAFLPALEHSGLKADLFTFSQALPETEPKYSYTLEWDNWAIAATTNFAAWWEGLPQESRKNVRRAERRGVVVKLVDFDDELVRGIKGIYDETPLRQGRLFWHYKKDFETVRRENSSYVERSQFIGAYHQDDLIGFIKMVYVGATARIMQILSKEGHVDKRPTNALLAKAVEACSRKGASHLIYGQYIYGSKSNSPVTVFKRRNGFQQLLLPRYYVPLTAKGRAAIALRLHRGAKDRLPEWLVSSLLNARLWYYEHVRFRPKPGGLQTPELKSSGT